MNTRRIFLALMMTGVLITPVAMMGSASPSQSANRLEGTWDVTATFMDQSFKVLFTFMPGRSENEGTLVDTNEFELTPNPICTPDQGVWQRTGPRDFIATHFTFCFDETSTPPGNPFGKAKVRDVITLSENGEEFDGRQFVEVFDTSGNVVFSGHIPMHGVRVHAEAPPPAP